MDGLPNIFPDRLITFTGEDFEMAGGSGASNSDLEEQEDEPEAGPSSSFDIESICHNGHVLANQYELVRTIFSYLPMRDLENCGQVDMSKTFQISFFCTFLGFTTVGQSEEHLHEGAQEIRQCELLLVWKVCGCELLL